MDSTVITVASELHEQWRAPRRLTDGTFEPRWKDDDTVDIANTDFADLPSAWQAENLAAAAAALDAVTTSTTLEEVAETVHRDWLARNGQWAPAEQKLPYAELSEVEKEKDRVVARLAASAAGIRLT